MGNLSNRKKIEDLIIKTVESLTDKENGDMYRKLFKNMSDEKFSSFADRVSNGSINLAIIQAPGKKHSASVEKALKTADSLDVSILDNVVLEEPEGPIVLNVETMFLRLPVKRQVQILSHKIGVPTHDKTIDASTGQRVNSSKGAKITQPELQLLDALGADKILLETMKVRGGDNGAYRAYTSSLENFGSANLDNIDRFSTGVQSSATLEAIFNSMMLDINLTKKTF